MRLLLRVKGRHQVAAVTAVSCSSAAAVTLAVAGVGVCVSIFSWCMLPPRMTAWLVLPVLAQLALAAAAGVSSTPSVSSPRPGSSRPSSGAGLERSSQVGFLESSLLGVLPSAMLTRYLSRLRLGGALNEPQVLMSTVRPTPTSVRKTAACLRALVLPLTEWTFPLVQEELIRREGYPVETYTVRAQDGYMPLLVRIPRGRQNNASAPASAPARANGKAPKEGLKAPKQPRTPVLITHGVLQCSDNWVLRGRDHDLREHGRLV